MTVGDQILLTVFVTLATYVLIFLMSRLSRWETVKDHRISRRAEQMVIFGKHRLESYDAILDKLGEASVMIRSMHFKLGVQAYAQSETHLLASDFSASIAKIDEALALSARIGYIAVLEGDKFVDQLFEAFLYDRYSKMTYKNEDPKELFLEVNSNINDLKDIVIKYRGLDLRAISLQHEYANKPVPKKYRTELSNELKRLSNESGTDIFTP